MWNVNYERLNILDFRSEETQNYRCMSQLLGRQANKVLPNEFLLTIKRVHFTLKCDILFISVVLQHAIELANKISAKDTFLSDVISELSAGFPDRTRERILDNRLLIPVIERLKKIRDIMNKSAYQSASYLENQSKFLNYIYQLSDDCLTSDSQVMQMVIELDPRQIQYISGCLLNEIQQEQKFYLNLLSQNLLNLSDVPLQVKQNENFQKWVSSHAWQQFRKDMIGLFLSIILASIGAYLAMSSAIFGVVLLSLGLISVAYFSYKHINNPLSIQINHDQELSHVERNLTCGMF